MSFATPLPPAYSKTYSARRSYQPLNSTSDKSESRFRSSSKRSRWSRKAKKEEMSDYGNPYGRDEKSLACSRTTSSSGTSTRTSTSDSTNRKSRSASKLAKSSKSSRSWIKRVLVGESNEDINEDPDAKRRERNAMWRNMSMGYEMAHISGDVGEFIGRAFRSAGPWTGGLPAGMPASASPYYFGP